MKTLFVVGETASGKSDYAVRLARELDGEVISADSRQVYKQLDIGSGKITKPEMQSISHHLLDVAEPGQVFTLADFLPMAEAAISEIGARGKLPIICGGTGLYIDALLAGYHLSDQVADNLKTTDIKKLRSMLDRDVLAGLTLEEQNNHQHLAALVARGGQNLPPKWPDRNRPAAEIHYCQWPPEQLRQRIAARISSRIDEGMIDEVRSLIDSGVSDDWLKSLGLEYRFITRFLEGGLGKEQMVNQLEIATWRFTRKQRNWIKRWPIDKTLDCA